MEVLMPSEIQLIAGTIISLEATVAFHEKRGPLGDYARARALVHLAAARERLVDARKRRVQRAKEAAAEALLRESA
jgi:hypothetical protein